MAGTAPLATAAEETISAVTADTDDQTVGISYADGGAARAIEYGVFASRISITAENVQFGGDDGHSFRIRNGRGQRVTVDGPPSASVVLSGRAVFEIYTAEGTVADDPRISYAGSDEDIPVDVRGDTDMFSSGTVFDAYVVEVLADGTVLDATDEKTIGIGYEPDATATERDGGTRVAISRPEGWEDSWSAYLEIVIYDDNRVVVNEQRYEFERDGQRLVATYDDTGEKSPPEGGFQDTDLLFFVEGSPETSPPNLWAAIHGDLDTTAGGEQASATIREFDAPTAVVEPGDSATGTATVRNTGDAERTFFVGYSVIAPDRRVLDNNGSTGTTVTLEADEETTVELSWMATSTAPSGPYDAVTAVWKESDPDQLATRLDQAVREDAFTLEDGALPGGTSILPPITPETFPFSHTQSIEYDAVGPDRSGVEGDGIRIRVDREYVDDDRMTVTVGIDSPAESLVEEISGYGVSQVLLLYNDADLTLDGEIRSRVDGGTPRALESLRPVKNVASIASTVATGGLSAIVKEGVAQVAETAAEDWVTSRIEFDTPPTLSETEDVSVIDVDFSTETVPAATSPATLDEYELETTFSVEPNAESVLTVVFDLRGRSETVFTPAEGNRITGAAATSHELPVEYRRQVNVPLDSAGGSGRADSGEATDGNGPGFGILGTLSGIAGGGYLLRRLFADDVPER